MTFSTLIFSPLSYLGENIGLFFGNMFRHIPVYLFPIVFVFLVIMAILVFLPLSGYSVNVMHLFQLQAPPRREPISSREVEQRLRVSNVNPFECSL